MVTIGLFIYLVTAMALLVFVSLKAKGIVSIFTSLICIMLAFINSKIIINGTLIQNIGGVDGSGNIVQGTTIIQIESLSYILLFVGMFMVVILAIQVLREIKFRESQDTIELDI